VSAVAVADAGRLRTRRALVSVWTLGVCGLLPLLALGAVLVDLLGGDAGWAFRLAFLGAAEAVLAGDSLYPALEEPTIAAGTAYVYPPLLALVVTPFTLVGANVAAFGFALLLVAAVPATLFVLGVRDWRCYGIVLLWPAVLSAIHVENITILMGLAAALVWRYRDHGAGSVGFGVSLAVKPLLWPLAVWLVATRRVWSAVWGAVVALAVALASWGVVRFDGLVEYEALVRRLGDVMDEWGYSVYALALDLGLSDSLARGLWLLLGVGLLAMSFLVSRCGQDRRGFLLAVAAVIACSPIVWLHYFALLVVVVAVAQPSFGPLWLVPLALYGAEEIGNGTPLQTALALAAAAVTVGFAFHAASDEPELEEGRAPASADAIPVGSPAA
jgi:Glycosyltransferase family 87